MYGGEELVMSGATASNAIINGGFQDDAGAAIGTTINNSGIEIVESGATATGTTVNGGEQLVNAGGIARNTVINGGTEYVFAGGTANGVTFGGHTGVLQLEQPGSLTGVISGWQTGDAIDFNGTVTGAVINGSTLQVTLSGGQSFSYQLAGQQSGTVIRIDYPGNGSVLRLVAKSPPLVTAALAHDTGTSATDKITADPALIGAGDPNATVHFTIDGTPNAATVTADAAGAWRYTPAGLADGVHTIVASETDAAGQTGISSLTFRLDTDTALAPSLVVGGGGTPTLNAAASHNVSFVLAGLDDETGTAIFSDGLNSIAVAVSGNGSYAVDLSTLNDGPISSRLTLGDPAGNNFSASGNQVNLDTDKGVMPRLLVNGGQPVIGVVHGSAVAFTVASRMRPGRQHSATAPIPSSSRSTAMALSRQTSAPLIPLPSARR